MVCFVVTTAHVSDDTNGINTKIMSIARFTHKLDHQHLDVSNNHYPLIINIRDKQLYVLTLVLQPYLCKFKQYNSNACKPVYMSRNFTAERPANYCLCKASYYIQIREIFPHTT